ncbi:YhdP family protein [Roseateles koreensis]|uniref:YhdP family protein n=1 Tax=Roseateles koreensis TaxID=2987526 RepID=A0ABT5KW87_9BURK|nr:YhdP family protein [Roseateles koreensis]MDC8787217.1 YhdP family protein [Roseateles koreensis]
MSLLAKLNASAARWCRTPMRLALRVARWALGLTLLLWALLLAAWLVLHWAILPHIDDWRGTLERRASERLGVQLRIGQISVSSGGWIPAVEMRQVVFLDPQGREALRLPRVAAALSARSLLAMELRFEQLLIDAPQLVVRRDAQGRIFLAGLSMESANTPETADLAGAWADWLLVQHEFVILNGRVRWIDERRAAPPLELSSLNLVLRNSLHSHAMRLDATPPPEWGQRFSLQGRFTQPLLKRAGEFKSWSGQLYMDLPQADLRHLRRHVNLPFELSDGDGALRAWAEIKNGRPQSVTADIGLRLVKLRLAAKAEMLELARVEGRLQLQQQHDELALTATQLGFVSGDGVEWPRSDWRIALQLPAPAQVRGGVEPAGSSPFNTDLSAPLGGSLQAQRLDFALMAQLAQRLPVGEAARGWLRSVAPQGVLRDLNASWQGPLDAPTRYRVKGAIDGLSLAAGPVAEGAAPGVGRPGVQGASLQVDASERGGRASLNVSDGALILPGVLEEATVPLSRLSTNLDWRINSVAGKPDQLEVHVGDLRLATPDAQGEFNAVWRSGVGGAKPADARFPGSLELSGSVDRMAANRVRAYLPLSVGEATRSYLLNALRSGEARNTQIRLRGALQDFPFDGGRPGVFRISTQAHDVEFAYASPEPVDEGQAPPAHSWPALQHTHAELIFERNSLFFKNGHAQVLGYELSGVNGGIKDLAHARVLELEGSGRGPTAELLRYLHMSSLEEWTGGALSQAQATGPSTLKLALKLPLLALERNQIKGTVQLMGNELRIRPEIPLLSNTRGKIEFDQQSVKVSGGQARALGGDLSLEGGSLSGGGLAFTVQGQASAEGLRRAAELGALARLAQSASGQATYRLQLGVNQGRADLNLNSNLQGLALDLPAPLHKDADMVLPLHLQLTNNGQASRDELRLELGGTLQAYFLRDTSTAQPRVLRGAIGVQDKLPPLPTSGVHLAATFDALNLDAWNVAAQKLSSGGAGLGAPTTTAGADPGSSYLPQQINLRALHLHLAGRSMSHVVANISRVGGVEGEGWRFGLDADQLSGLIEVRGGAAGQASAPGRVFARLSRLSLPKQEVDSVTQLLDQGSGDVHGGRPAGSVPALDVVIDDFELRGKRLGRLEVQAQANGPQRDWRLTKLQIKSPDAVLNATGHWLAEPAFSQRRTQLDWQLDVLDAGAMLDRMGEGKVLRGGKGQMVGQLGWLGSPLSPDFATMNGQLKLTLASGQFLNAEPGVGRLLGVLSLQSLPRRFLLDFRDVFSEGFTFDGVGGDVTIEHGVASSNNLRMRGLQATVAVEGQADLAAETQNLHVLVVPEVSMGGASLAYAAINPAVGLGAFLAQWVLSRPMAVAGTRQFHITGSWVDPKVEKVEKLDAPDKSASAPALPESSGKN